MALSKPKIASIGLLSTAGLSGAGVMTHNLINKETFKGKLKGTLLTNSKEDEIKWAGRADLLSKDNSPELTDSLKAIKTASKRSEKLQAWCENNLNQNYSKEGQLFKDIQKYCSYTVKEKLTNPIDISKWDPNTNNKKLKEMSEDRLSPEMKEIKKKLIANEVKDENALKDWCISLESIPFKNEDDQMFKDGNTYCTS